MKFDVILNDISNRNVKKFLIYVFNKLEKMEVKVCLDGNVSRIGVKTSGFYSDFDKIIRCYIDQSNFMWLGTLAHEFAHATQAHKQTKEWIDFNELELTTEDILINRKLPASLQHFRRVIIALEWDAEKKAINLIKKFNLPIDINKYIQEANLVLIKYVFLTHKRTWPNFKNGYQDRLIEQMPIKLMPTQELVWSKLDTKLKTQLEEFRIK